MDVYVEQEKEDVCNAEKGVREEGRGVEGWSKEGGGGGGGAKRLPCLLRHTFRHRRRRRPR